MLLAVVALALVVGACFGDSDPLSPDIPDCVRPQADTTGWQRVTESVPDAGSLGGSARVSYLVPPAFEKAGERRWERNATIVGWEVSFAAPVEQPYEDLVYTGSCRASIAGRTVVLDYGGLNSGGPVPDLAIIVHWPNMPLSGTSGNVLFHARMRDQSDSRVVEQMLWSVQILRGPPPGA